MFEFSRFFKVVGYDNDLNRLEDLKKGIDKSKNIKKFKKINKNIVFSKNINNSKITMYTLLLFQHL